MAADVELLPLPEPALDWPTGVWLSNGSRVLPGSYFTDEQVRANVEANTEALRTERDAYKSKYHRAVDDLSAVSEQAEALRAEVQFLRSYRPIARRLTEVEARAERLAEALRKWSSDGSLQTFEDRQRFRTEARAALHPTAAQEAARE